MKQPSSTPKYYRPYEKATLDTPLVHMILEPILPALRPVLEGIFRFRWLLTRPLELRILPKWMPTCAYSLVHLTLGDVLLSFPLVVFLFAGYNQSFVAPSVEESGVTASYSIYWTFLTANKANSLLSFFFGIPFERMLPHHYMASFVTLVLGGFHTYVAFAYGGSDDGSEGGDSESGERYLVASEAHARRQLSGDDSQYGLTGSNPNFVKFLMDGDNNFSGSLLFIALALLLLTSFFRIFRKHFFDLWLALHVALAISVIVFCVLHEVVSVLFVALWWSIDLAARYVVMAGCRYPTKATIRKIVPDVCELTFPKPPGFHYNPGQFVQIAVRDISNFQFHPISISSAPHEEFVTLHIRALGGWSGKLVDLAEEVEREVSILLEGPYGSLTLDLDDRKRYKHILLVCGGIGVTHCQSVGKALQYQAYREGRDLNSMRLIWSVRDLNMVHDMPPLQDSKIKKKRRQDKGNQACISREIYCTRAGQPDIEDQLPAGIRVRAHRPDLDKIFREMKQQAVECGEVNIAVFGCGPNGLMDTLKECCRAHSQSVASCGGVFFDLHMEHFEF